jgi:hypothetical protein
VERLTQSLGVGADTAAALIDQAKTLASQLRTARAMQRQQLAGHQERVRELQAASQLIRVFQPTVVPGLLQTAEYARQVFLRGGLARSGLVNTAALAEAVTARLDRQATLFDPSKRFVFLLTESALRARICARTAMQVQVDRILAMASLENITVGYIPTGADLDVLPFNGFTIYDDQVVSVETISAQLTLRDERDIALYADTFEHLMTAALVGKAAFGALRDLYSGLGSDAELEQEPSRPATA